MIIDPDSPAPLAAALRQHPATRHIHPSTARRWWAKGVKVAAGGVVKLAGCVVGSRLHVSLNQITEFIRATSERPGDVPAPRSPAKRQRESEAAAKELELMGV